MPIHFVQGVDGCVMMRRAGAVFRQLIHSTGIPGSQRYPPPPHVEPVTASFLPPHSSTLSPARSALLYTPNPPLPLLNCPHSHFSFSFPAVFLCLLLNLTFIQQVISTRRSPEHNCCSGVHGGTSTERLAATARAPIPVLQCCVYPKII